MKHMLYDMRDSAIVLVFYASLASIGVLLMLLAYTLLRQAPWGHPASPFLEWLLRWLRG